MRADTLNPIFRCFMGFLKSNFMHISEFLSFFGVAWHAGGRRVVWVQYAQDRFFCGCSGKAEWDTELLWHGVRKGSEGAGKGSEYI